MLSEDQLLCCLPPVLRRLRLDSLANSRALRTSVYRQSDTWTRTRRDLLPPVLPSVSQRPALPEFSSSAMTQPPSTTTAPTTTAPEEVDSVQLDEKQKQFEKEEMERRERFEKEILAQQSQSLIERQQEQLKKLQAPEPTSNKFQEKRKKNIILDEERFEETFLKCLICRENFDLDEKMPKMLPCHHTFCMDCLCQMWRVEGEFRQTLTSAFRGMPMAVKIQCPTCRDGLITSESEVRRLPNDHTIMELLSFMKDTKRSDVQYCSKHQMQHLNFFCEPCVTPVCCDCTVIDHKESKGHIVVNVNEAIDKYTPIIEATVEDIKTETTHLEEKKTALIKGAEKLDSTQKEVNDKIKEVFTRMKETIEERERELYEMTEREVARKREKIEENLKVVIDREGVLNSEMKKLNSAKTDKDISTMFSGHKSARDVLGQKASVVTDCADTFSIQFNCDDRKDRNIRQEVTNLADIVFLD